MHAFHKKRGVANIARTIDDQTSYSYFDSNGQSAKEIPAAMSHKGHMRHETSCFCRAELNSRINFDKSTAEVRRLNQT